jgi:hypothetical protein
MSWLDAVWLQRGLDALRETVDADPAMKRDMIEFLLDEGFWKREKLDWESAIARFNACLNPNKPEYFRFVELWALMKRFHRHALFLAMAEDLGYEVRHLPTEARRQALLERIATACEQHNLVLAECSGELRRIDSTPPGTGRFDPAVRAGTASFSLPTEPVQGF